MIGSPLYTKMPITKQSNLGIKIGISCLAVALIIFMFSKKDTSLLKNKDTSDPLVYIVDTIMNRTPEIKSYSRILDITDDPSIRKEHSYIGKRDLLMSRDDMTGLNYDAFSVEIFNNTKDLEIRKQQLLLEASFINTNFPIEEYGKLANQLGLPDHFSIYNNKNALLIYDSTVDQKLINQTIKLFDTACNSLEFNQVDVPTTAKIDELNRENTFEINKKIEKYKTLDIEQSLQQLKGDMNKRVECAYISLDRQSLQDVATKLSLYNVSLTKSDYTNWSKIINEANSLVDNPEIPKLILEKRQEYQQKVLSNGTYIVGRDILPGEYVIIGNGGYKLSGSSSELIEIYGNTILTLSYNQEVILDVATMYHINNSPSLELKVPGIYKVGTHIPAGSYHFSAESYVNLYITNNSNVSTMQNLSYEKSKGNPNYNYFNPGPPGLSVTLEDGQYLVMYDDRIQVRKE